MYPTNSIWYIELLQVELNHLNKAYKAVSDQMALLFSQRLWYIMLEQFLMKYVWSGTGMIMVSIPIIFGTKGSNLFFFFFWITNLIIV